MPQTMPTVSSESESERLTPEPDPQPGSDPFASLNPFPLPQPSPVLQEFHRILALDSSLPMLQTLRALVNQVGLKHTDIM
jgi:hypothetical protein